MKRSKNRRNDRLRNIATALGSMFIVLVLAFTFLSLTTVKVASANSAGSNVVASANVQSYCEIGSSNSAINFGSLQPTGYIGAANLIVANSVGNAAGNVLVWGGNWILSATANFAVGNTLWNPTTTASQGVGNALTNTPVNTFIALPITAGVTSTNNIFFGMNVPSGVAPGIYTQSITLQNSCNAASTPGSNTFVVTATVNVLGVCFINLYNGLITSGGVSLTAINFGAINPGTNTPFTSNLVVDYNTNGNVNTNVLVEGTSWINGGNNFFVTNTLWAPSSVAYGSATTTPLTLFPGNLVNTNIEIPYPPTSSSNNIYFGVAVPPGEPSGVYTSNILLENLC